MEHLPVYWPNQECVKVLIFLFIEERHVAMRDSVDVSDSSPRTVVPFVFYVIPFNHSTIRFQVATLWDANIDPKAQTRSRPKTAN